MDFLDQACEVHYIRLLGNVCLWSGIVLKKYVIGFHLDLGCRFGFLEFLESLDNEFKYVSLGVLVLVGLSVTV